MSRSAHRTALVTQIRLDGERVTYRRAADDSAFTTDALRGQTHFKEQAEDRGARIVRSTDWIFDLAEFRTRAACDPEDGDTITVTSDEGAKFDTEFRVNSFNGEPSSRIDPTRTQLRVHTTEQTTERL